MRLTYHTCFLASLRARFFSFSFSSLAARIEASIIQNGTSESLSELIPGTFGALGFFLSLRSRERERERDRERLEARLLPLGEARPFRGELFLEEARSFRGELFLEARSFGGELFLEEARSFGGELFLEDGRPARESSRFPTVALLLGAAERLIELFLSRESSRRVAARDEAAVPLAAACPPGAPPPPRFIPSFPRLS